MCHTSEPRCSACNRRNRHHRRNCTSAYPSHQAPDYHVPHSCDQAVILPAPSRGCEITPRCSSCNRRGNCRHRSCTIPYPASQPSQLPPLYDSATSLQQNVPAFYAKALGRFSSPRRCVRGCGCGSACRQQCRGPITTIVGFLVK